MTLRCSVTGFSVRKVSFFGTLRGKGECFMILRPQRTR